MMNYRQIVALVSDKPWLTNTINVKIREFEHERKAAVSRIVRVLEIDKEDAEKVWDYILEQSVNGIYPEAKR
jgi:hypothetical protein